MNKSLIFFAMLNSAVLSMYQAYGLYSGMGQLVALGIAVTAVSIYCAYRFFKLWIAPEKAATVSLIRDPADFVLSKEQQDLLLEITRKNK